ncbi:transposase [Aeribacillus pallidus]|uniref:Transposase IS4-like domain-containing protein n=1 Tax=Aeribacillus pallidus TaxID=33936 RepID=A0A223E1B4_9BACI|nr:transposase [Aeribacillus pallidus]ASS89042.1 hypothetical protein AP3564_01075 [Aeribacillus pallidus]
MSKNLSQYPWATFRKTKTGVKRLTILTSYFYLTAKEIADLYCCRWKIEIFFNWMKQHLKSKTFYGKSQNEVYNKIWIACLQALIQMKYRHEKEVSSMYKGA